MLKRIFLTTIIAIGIHSVAQADDKLDVQSLEKKYFASKDDDFSVIQNRTYTKEKKVFLGANIGIPFNDLYSTGTLVTFEGGYFLNERLGFELNLLNANFNDNDLSTFSTRFGAYPDHNRLLSMKMLTVNYVPFYAKMSVLDKSIVYFDMGFSLGLGTTEYMILKEEGNEIRVTPSYQIGIYQQIFISEHMSIKVNVLNTFTTEQKYTFKQNPGSGLQRDQGEKVFNDTAVTVGAVFTFDPVSAYNSTIGKLWNTNPSQ